MTISSTEGMRRYPDSGCYTPSFQNILTFACSCVVACAKPCKGVCGCKACDFAWRDLDGKPSGEGLKRYAGAAGYYPPRMVGAKAYACQCLPICKDPCKGTCGCIACEYFWAEYRSVAGFGKG